MICSSDLYIGLPFKILCFKIAKVHLAVTIMEEFDLHMTEVSVSILLSVLKKKCLVVKGNHVSLTKL